MNKKESEIIYKFILQNCNGWSDEDILELDLSEMECDSLFEKICMIESLGAKNE